MRRSRATSCPRSANRPGRLEACRRSRRSGKARESDGSDAWRSEPSNGGFHEPSGVLSSMVKPWLVGVVEPVLGTECSWLLVRDLPEHGVLVGSSQVAAGLAELLVVEQPAAEPSIRDRLFVVRTFDLVAPNITPSP